MLEKSEMNNSHTVATLSVWHLQLCNKAQLNTLGIFQYRLTAMNI